MPVAVNLYKVRKAEDEGGKLFRSVQRQKDQYQGIWIVSPEGKVLAGYHPSHNDHRAYVREVLETLNAGLKSFGAVKPRTVKAADPLPHRGKGLLPDGGASLAVYTRCMHNDKPDGPPVIDSLTLTKEEWAAFMPPKLAEETAWSLPEALAKKLVRALSPSSDQGAMPRPEEATVAKLGAVVEANDGKTVRIRWTGKLEAKHVIEGDAKRMTFGAATVEGAASAEVSSRSLKSLLLVARGTYRYLNDEPRQTGAVVEWTEAQPADKGKQHSSRRVSQGLEVTESGKSPSRKVSILSPGVYQAVVYQEAGGGIMEFYDLVQDPKATWNLAGWDRGLFEVGWHGATFQSPADKKDCCLKHMLEKNREGACYDGTRDWPSIGHKNLKAEGELEVVEQSRVRVRVRAKSWFVWWSKYADRDLPVEAIYTFYPAGQIFIQVRVTRTGSSPMHWSREYGPHLSLRRPRTSLKPIQPSRSAPQRSRRSRTDSCSRRKS